MTYKDIMLCGKLYFVGDDGAIYTKSGKPMSKYLDRDGYEYIVIRRAKNGIRKKYLVHRLVGICFIPNSDDRPQINHIDGNKRNNSATNLEWVTNSENQMHSRYTLGNQTGFCDMSVRCVETGKVYKSTRAAWRDTGISYSHISEAASGKRKSAGGYHWEQTGGQGCAI